MKSILFNPSLWIARFSKFLETQIFLVSLSTTQEDLIPKQSKQDNSGYTWPVDRRASIDGSWQEGRDWRPSALLLSFGFIELTDSVGKHVISVRTRASWQSPVLAPWLAHAPCVGSSHLFLSSSFSPGYEPVWLTHALAAGFLMFTAAVDAKIGQAYRAPPTRKRKKRSAAKIWGRLGTFQTVRRHFWSFPSRFILCWSFNPDIPESFSYYFLNCTFPHYCCLAFERWVSIPKWLIHHLPQAGWSFNFSANWYQYLIELKRTISENVYR